MTYTLKLKAGSKAPCNNDTLYAQTSVSGCCYIYISLLEYGDEPIKIGWIPTAESPQFCRELTQVYLLSNGKITFNPCQTIFANKCSEVFEPSNTTKKETMFQKLISTNQAAATQAAVLESGRIANKTLARIIEKRFPGLPQTPFNDLILANLVSVIATQVKPSPTLKKVADAMVTEAYQEVYQLIDLEGMIAELLIAVPDVTVYA